LRPDLTDNSTVRVDGRPPVVTLMAILAAAMTLGACGASKSGSADAPNPTAYLSIVHSPLAGTIATQDDASLLALGQRACGDLDRGLRSDAVVADLGGDPLPGSADFNTYSVVTAAAARELCPTHRAEFPVGPDTLSGH
jgi:hypothetical protein